MRIAELDTPAVIVDLDVLGATSHPRVSTAPRIISAYARTPRTTKFLPLRACKWTLERRASRSQTRRGGGDGRGRPGILIAYPIFGPTKTERLVRLAAEHTIMVALDSAIAAEGISRTGALLGSAVNVLIEFRCGPAPLRRTESIRSCRLGPADGSPSRFAVPRHSFLSRTHLEAAGAARACPGGTQ